MKKGTKKPIFPQRGTIIFLLKDGMTVSGIGSIDGVKLISGELRFTGTLIKDYSKKKKNK